MPNPGLVLGQVPSPGDWNSYFEACAAVNTTTGMETLPTITGYDGLGITNDTHAAVFVTNPNDHNIARFGSADAGRTFRLVFQAGVGIIIDQNKIRGPSKVGYSYGGTTFPTNFIDDATLNILSPQPGDTMEIMSLGNIATDGGCAWQVLSYTPWKAFSMGSVYPDAGSATTADFWGIGLRGWGANPWTSGILCMWQPGTSKTILPAVIMTGPGDSYNKLYRNIAGSNGVAGGAFNAYGEMVPVDSTLVTQGAGGTKDQWRFFINDSNGHPVIGPTSLAGWPSTPGSIVQGNSFEDWVVATQAPANTSRGAVRLWAITGNNQINPVGRMYLHGTSGNQVLMGKAAFEAAGYAVNYPANMGLPNWAGLPAILWTMPTADMNPITDGGWGNSTIITTDMASSVCGFNAGIAMRRYGVASHAQGLDVGWSSTDPGYETLWAVVAGLRTAAVKVDSDGHAGRVVFPQGFQSLNGVDESIIEADASGVTNRQLRLVNGGSATSTGVELGLQAGPSTSLNTAHLQAVNLGSNNVNLLAIVKNGGADLSSLSLDHAGAIFFLTYGAGSLSVLSGGQVVSTSDAKLKNFIQPMAGALPKGNAGRSAVEEAFRAMGPPRLYTRKDEMASVEEAREGLPELRRAVEAAAEALTQAARDLDAEESPERRKPLDAALRAADRQHQTLRARLDHQEHVSSLKDEELVRVGWFAQDVQRAAPWAVGRNREGDLTLDDRGPVAVLALMVGEILERLECLEGRTAAKGASKGGTQRG